MENPPAAVALQYPENRIIRVSVVNNNGQTGPCRQLHLGFSADAYRDIFG